MYLVRLGKRNPELRYSIRSLQNTGIDRVILVGYCPPWLDGVEHLPTGQADRAEKAKNVRRGYEAIAAEGPDEFVLFNDDHFVMKPLKRIEPTHRGRLADLVRRSRPTGYYKGLKAAVAVLDEDSLAYDALHTPMPMTKTALKTALDLYDGIHGLRTVVGNLLDLGGTEHPNAKNPPSDKWPDMTYLSTSDKSFKYRDIGAYIRKRLPTPSRFEVSE